jgi:hypothetical protein
VSLNLDESAIIVIFIFPIAVGTIGKNAAVARPAFA